MGASRSAESTRHEDLAGSTAPPGDAAPVSARLTGCIVRSGRRPVPGRQGRRTPTARTRAGDHALMDGDARPRRWDRELAVRDVDGNDSPIRIGLSEAGHGVRSVDRERRLCTDVRPSSTSWCSDPARSHCRAPRGQGARSPPREAARRCRSSPHSWASRAASPVPAPRRGPPRWPSTSGCAAAPAVC